MILQQGEKIHVVHRRHFEKDPHRHFIGVVDAYENGILRATGHVYTVDLAKLVFVRRPELRTRVISVVAGDVFVNVIPQRIDLNKIVYSQERKGVRVTDGSDWRLDLSEYTWL
jgi:hypothetical protein